MKKINTDLPTQIYSYTVALLIDKINEVNQDAEISWDSWGGSTGSGQKFIEFLNNKENKLNANVAGYAVSMGAVMLPFFDHVKGSKQADVMIHSVSGGPKSTRKHTNQFLYEALAKKIDEPKFKKITGFDLETVMLAEDEDRVDVWMTGTQAGEIGLFDETYDLLDKAASFEQIDFTDIGYEVPNNIKEKYSKKAKIVKSNTNEMEIKDVTQSQLLSGNPSVHAAIVKEAREAEQLRVVGIMKYAEFDMPKAIELIEKGAALSIENVEHFLEKKHAAIALAALEDGSEGEIKPGKKEAKVESKPQTKEAKEMDEALNELNVELGLDEPVTDKK